MTEQTSDPVENGLSAPYEQQLVQDHVLAANYPITTEDLNRAKENLLKRDQFLLSINGPIQNRIAVYIANVVAQVGYVESLKRDVKDNNSEQSLRKLRDEIPYESEAGRGTTRAATDRLLADPAFNELKGIMNFQGQEYLIPLLENSDYFNKLLPQLTDPTPSNILARLTTWSLGWMINKAKTITIDDDDGSPTVKDINRSSGSIKRLPYAAHIFDVLYSAKGVKRLTFAEMITIIKHDDLEKCTEFVFDKDTLTYKQKTIDQENFTKMFGDFGNLIYSNVQMLTEEETKDHFGRFATEGGFQQAYATTKEKISTTIQSGNTEFQELVANLKSEDSEVRKKSEALLIQRIADFGNLSWGLRESLVRLKPYFDSQDEEGKQLLVELVIKPRLTTEIGDRFITDAATLPYRTIARSNLKDDQEKVPEKDKWTELDAVAYYERFDDFLLSVHNVVAEYGLEDYYLPMLTNAVATIQETKRQIHEELGWEITSQKIEEFRKVRKIVTEELVEPFISAKVDENIALVKEVISKYK